ncbi:hypothetical protein FGO68_gene1864 [Halteria grandinella]|uniref:Uncharacterized protein n=1 Tax=Halteria grandinella TaxID=5974 RepID=A0A8J8SY75_HALGN|nr:hypothetical protein FGO68_gene1864 [Halteria grandinella]
MKQYLSNNHKHIVIQNIQVEYSTATAVIMYRLTPTDARQVDVKIYPKHFRKFFAVKIETNDVINIAAMEHSTVAPCPQTANRIKNSIASTITKTQKILQQSNLYKLASYSQSLAYSSLLNISVQRLNGKLFILNLLISHAMQIII